MGLVGSGAPVAISRSRGYGGHVKIDRDGPYAVVVFGLLSILVITSFVRFVRRRRRWERRQHVKRYDRPDDPPPSTDVAPIEVRAEGSPKSMIVLGDDDDQFRLRARPGVLLVLDDGTRGTLREGTPLKCTFPGFSIVTNASGKGSVGVTAGTTFYIVATKSAEPVQVDVAEAHPFRRGGTMVTELQPVLDRYECRLDPVKPKRRALAKLMPEADRERRPRWNPVLYPGIPIGLVVLGWYAIDPMFMLLIGGILFAILASIEEVAWRMSGED